MQALVRVTYEDKNKNTDTLPIGWRQELNELYSKQQEILDALKRIYIKKLDVIKIRIHGNYHLGQILLTGKDIAITDFGGDPVKSFSDRRLKRSPLRDVAAMIRSFRYVCYEGFLKTTHAKNNDINTMLPYARLWAHHMTGFFLHAYFETVSESAFIPKDKGDLLMMLDTYLLEKSMYDLKFELAHRPEMVIVPMRTISSILDRI